MILSSIIIAIALIGIFTGGFGITGRTTDNNYLKIGDSPVLGKENAPITIYVFSDFSCPYCAAADGYNEQALEALRTRDASWEPPIPGIINEYVNAGKAKLVFKYYPGHGTARAAHIIALALNEQDLFWEFHDKAFENQKDTSNVNALKNIAEQLGADINKLDSDIKSNDYESQLTKDIEMAKAIGIKGTPSFVINGKIVEGAVSYSEIKITSSWGS